MGCFCFSNTAGPVPQFRSAILDVWRGKVSADLCVRKGFRGGLLLDFSSFNAAP